MSSSSGGSPSSSNPSTSASGADSSGGGLSSTAVGSPPSAGGRRLAAAAAGPGSPRPPAAPKGSVAAFGNVVPRRVTRSELTKLYGTSIMNSRSKGGIMPLMGFVDESKMSSCYLMLTEKKGMRPAFKNRFLNPFNLSLADAQAASQFYINVRPPIMQRRPARLMTPATKSAVIERPAKRYGGAPAARLLVQVVSSTPVIVGVYPLVCSTHSPGRCRVVLAAAGGNTIDLPHDDIRPATLRRAARLPQSRRLGQNRALLRRGTWAALP